MARVSKADKDWVAQQFAKARSPKKVKTRIQVGRVYHYDYKSKLYHMKPKRLPFYDAHPLIICIGLYPNGWLGLSLHYLPPKVRRYFLEKILLKNRKRIQTNKPLTIPYRDMKSAFNLWYKEGITIIKRYLKSHVKSNVVHVPPEEWVNVISAEYMGKWVGTTASSVYGQTKQSLKQKRKQAYNVRHRTRQRLKAGGVKKALPYARKVKSGATKKKKSKKSKR